MKNNEFYKGNSFDVVSIRDSKINLVLPAFARRHDNNFSVPNFCAFENNYSNFNLISWTDCRVDTNSLYHIGLTFECSRCKKYITIEHTCSTTMYRLKPVLYKYSFINVKSPFSEDEIQEINKFSKDFLSIYDQTLTAENMHLDEIVVCGYRKALETLVKDYLFNYKGFDRAGDTALKNCIQDHMDEFIGKTIKVAKLAVDIGNDGIHWKSELDFDVEYMKVLIKMLCNDILNTIGEDEASAIFDKLEQDKKK